MMEMTRQSEEAFRDQQFAAQLRERILNKQRALREKAIAQSKPRMRTTYGRAPFERKGVVGIPEPYVIQPYETGASRATTVLRIPSVRSPVSDRTRARRERMNRESLKTILFK